MLGLQHTCSIARKQAIGTNGRRSLQTMTTGVSCLAIPMSARASVENKFEVGKAYDFFFDQNQDVNVGDVLTFNGSRFVARTKLPYIFPLIGYTHILAEQEIA